MFVNRIVESIFGANLPAECDSLHDINHAEVIVSLTSYPPRFATLHKVINSILNQSIKPQAVCLWIAEKDMHKLPENVLRLCDSGLEIYETADLKSYKKIIPCYIQNPDSVIVTCDDDVIYPKDWLRILYGYHKIYPEVILCHRARYITFAANGSVNPYFLWPNLDREIESKLVFPVGVGGVLYPKGCFDENLSNINEIMRLCEHGDDIWLKAMSLLKSVPCRKIHFYKKKFKHVKGSQKLSLKNENMEFRNDLQVERVFNLFAIPNKLRDELAI